MVLPDDKVKSIDFFNITFRGWHIPFDKLERNL